MGAFDSDWRKRREWWEQRVWLQTILVGLICFLPFMIAFGPAVAAGITAVLVAVVYALTRWMLIQRPRPPASLPRRDRALSDEQFRAILADPGLGHRQLLGRLPGVLVSASSLQQIADRHAEESVEPQTLEALVEDVHFTGTRLADLPYRHS